MAASLLSAHGLSKVSVTDRSPFLFSYRHRCYPTRVPPLRPHFSLAPKSLISRYNHLGGQGFNTEIGEDRIQAQAQLYWDLAGLTPSWKGSKLEPRV